MELCINMIFAATMAIFVVFVIEGQIDALLVEQRRSRVALEALLRAAQAPEGMKPCETCNGSKLDPRARPGRGIVCLTCNGRGVVPL